MLKSEVFFFQAGDGIRGAQESRGLGDVYKETGCSDPGTVAILEICCPGPDESSGCANT